MKKTLALLLALIIMVFCASCANTPADEQTSTPPADDTGTVYTIKDYYDANGGFSAVGSALDEENGEKVLKVNADDTLIVGDSRYKVTAEALTLHFYTQSSLDEVIVWWTDYMGSAQERGQVIDVEQG